MISKWKAIAFCESIVNKYTSQDKQIDYLIGDEFIKFFFYFKSANPFCNANVIDDLNSALKSYDLHPMCDFYMKLGSIKNSNKYDMCWTFFSYNLLGNYYVQRYFRT